MLETSSLIAQLRDLQDALPRDIFDSLDFPLLWLLGTSQWGKAVLLRVLLAESSFQEVLEQQPGKIKFL